MTRGHLLCAVAEDDAARDVVATGRALARATGLEPLFAAVAEVEVGASPAAVPAGAGIGWAPFPQGDFHAAEQRAIERSTEFLAGLGLDKSETRVTSGSPTAALHELADEVGAEAVVLGGAPGSGLKDLAMGSVPRWLAVNGHHPVVFARSAAQFTPDGPVVCGVDPHTDGAAHVAAVAARFAVLLDRPLVLAHVEQTPPGDSRRGAHDELDRIAGMLPAATQVEVALLEEGDEAARLAAEADARGASLVVTGNRGHGPIRSALAGSVSLELAGSARPPVVVVPPDARSTSPGGTI